MATDKCAQTICRSPEQIEYYGENWFIPATIRKSLIWEVGPEPYGSILWPRYISENYRVGIPSYYYFRNSAFTNIEILLEGKLTFTQNGITETIYPGEVYLMHEGADIHFSHGEDDMFHKMRFSLRSGMGSMIINKLRLNKYRILRPASLEPLIGIHSELYQLFLDHNRSQAPEISCLTYRLLTELARAAGQEDTSQKTLPPQLEQVTDYMQSHLKSQLNMSQVADFFGMEVHFLMRLFNKHLGVSPMKYFQQLKMEEAKHLIVGSILPIKVIALNLGFRDSLYFSTAFRRYFGVSPSEFRRQYQQHFD